MFRSLLRNVGQAQPTANGKYFIRGRLHWTNKKREFLSLTISANSKPNGAVSSLFISHSSLSSLAFNWSSSSARTGEEESSLASDTKKTLTSQRYEFSIISALFFSFLRVSQDFDAIFLVNVHLQFQLHGTKLILQISVLSI